MCSDWPTPIADEDALLLNISAEEAKSKELGFSLGYGEFEAELWRAISRARFVRLRSSCHSVGGRFRSVATNGECRFTKTHAFGPFVSRNRAGPRFTFDYVYGLFKKIPTLGDRASSAVSSRNNTKAGLVSCQRATSDVHADRRISADRFLGRTSYFRRFTRVLSNSLTCVKVRWSRRAVF